MEIIKGVKYDVNIRTHKRVDLQVGGVYAGLALATVKIEY